MLCFLPLAEKWILTNFFDFSFLCTLELQARSIYEEFLDAEAQAPVQISSEVSWV
jgi:alkyl hydroperoxide reductase subunit AhpC